MSNADGFNARDLLILICINVDGFLPHTGQVHIFVNLTIAHGVMIIGLTSWLVVCQSYKLGLAFEPFGRKAVFIKQ